MWVVIEMTSELATESGDAAVVVQFFEDRSPKPSITTPTNYTAGPYAHSNPVHGDVTGVATFYNLSPANPVTVNDFSGDLFSSDEMVAMTVVLEPKEDKPVEMGGFRSTRSAGNPPAITTPASSGTAPLIVVGYQDNTSTSTGFNEVESPAFDQEFNVGLALAVPLAYPCTTAATRFLIKQSTLLIVQILTTYLLRFS